MTRRPKLLAALPALALVAVAAVGCAPFHAGAAATVGSDRVTTNLLRSRTDAVVGLQPTAKSSTANATRTEVQSAVLGQLVAASVLARLAGQQGVTATADQTQTARTQLESQLLGSSTATGDVVKQATAAAAAKGLDFDGEVQILALYDALSDGDAVSDAAIASAYQAETDHHVYQLTELDFPSTVSGAEVIAALKKQPLATVSQAIMSSGGQAETVNLPGATLTAALQASADTVFTRHQVIGPLTLQGGGNAVLYIDAVTDRTLAQAQAPGSAERLTAFAAVYAATEKSLGVHVSPRFGSWTATGKDLTGLPLGSVGTRAAQLSTVVG